MKDIIAILLLSVAWVLLVMAWKKQAHEESIEVKSFKAARYCDDCCTRCPNNGWCTFSEVRK